MIDIKASSENFGSRTVKNSPKDHIKRPTWLDQYNDSLAFFFYRQDELLEKGTVVPASVVLANDKLYHRKGLGYRKDHPAYFIYSSDSYYEENTESLEELASKLVEISRSETKKTKEEKRISSLFEGGKNRPIRKKLPESLTDGREVFFTTVIVARKHLPQGRLSYKSYPLLIVCDDKSDSMLLPCRYWKYKGEK